MPTQPKGIDQCVNERQTCVPGVATSYEKPPVSNAWKPENRGRGLAVALTKETVVIYLKL